MTTWDLELIMMLQVVGVLQWLTALMAQGSFFFPPSFGESLVFSTCKVYVSHICVSMFGRLFSCGASKDGESYIVEWNESEGTVKRSYQGGFRKCSSGVVQFDTTRNRLIAAGDEFSIKIWDMDNVNLLTTIDADGGLPV